MKNALFVLTPILALGLLSACGVSQKKTVASKPQVVEFAESEVPHFQVTKKDGKLSTEIIDANISKVSAK